MATQAIVLLLVLCHKEIMALLHKNNGIVAMALCHRSQHYSIVAFWHTQQRCGKLTLWHNHLINNNNASSMLKIQINLSQYKRSLFIFLFFLDLLSFVTYSIFVLTIIFIERKIYPTNFPSFYLSVNLFIHSVRKPVRSFPALSLPSVTRLGDYLDFGQLFKAFGNN